MLIILIGIMMLEESMGNNDMNIMIIDDDILSLESLQRALQLHGYSSSMFIDPRSAITDFNIGKYNVVLTDYKMPGLNGIEVMKQIKRMDPETQLIMFTGYYQEEIRQTCMELGAYDFFCKPISIQALIADLKLIEINLK